MHFCYDEATRIDGLQKQSWNWIQLINQSIILQKYTHLVQNKTIIKKSFSRLKQRVRTVVNADSLQVILCIRIVGVRDIQV